MQKNEEARLKVVRCEDCHGTALWQTLTGWYCHSHLIDQMANDATVRRQVLRDLGKGLLQIQITAKGNPKPKPSLPLHIVELGAE